MPIKRPGRVKRVVKVNAPKPRGYEFLASSEFTTLKHELVIAVQSEVEGDDVTPAH